jgi:ribosomal protein S18 acetylase RimI-like enzyme
LDSGEVRVVVSAAGKADIATLVDLMAEFHAESNYPLDRQWAARSFGELMRNSDRGVAWIARRDAQPVGYVVMTTKHSMESGGPDAFIEDLFVRPDARRQGVAKALLDALFAECRLRGVLAVHVEVGHDNDAASGLYAAFGMRSKDRKHLTTG